MTLEQFTALLKECGIVLAGDYEGRKLGQLPPMEKTVSSYHLNKLDKQAKKFGSERLRNFFSTAFQGGKYDGHFNGERRFWTTQSSIEDWYQQLVDYLNHPNVKANYDEDGNYVKKARKELNAAGFRPRKKKQKPENQ